MNTKADKAAAVIMGIALILIGVLTNWPDAWDWYQVWGFRIGFTGIGLCFLGLAFTGLPKFMR